MDIIGTIDKSKYRDEIQKALDSAPKDWHKRERDVVGTICPPKFDNKIAQFIYEEELTRKCEKDCSG